MKHREVVANFIFRWTSPKRLDQQVALFRRSHHPNIRSYQGKYAPISGSIESDDANPISAAEREILEETQLIPGKDIALEFCGKSYSFEDHHAGRSWTVHPFGWILKARDSEIKIDWEHDDWTWWDPQQIFDGSISDQCVPKLDKSLQRVYFGPNGMFRGGGFLVGRGTTTGVRFLETIDRLKTDTENGASVLAFEALKGLHSIAECFQACPIEGAKPGEYWHSLVMVAYHFIYSARPSMSAAISAFLFGVLEEIEKSSENGEINPRVAFQVLETCMNQGQTSDKIAKSFKSFIDQSLSSTTRSDSSIEHEPNPIQAGTTINIITLSYSSTILTALTHLLTTSTHNPIDTLNLTILESRPLYEGTTLASSLIKSLSPSPSQQKSQPKLPRLNLKIVPESHTATILLETTRNPSKQQPTLIVLGADRITPYSNVINKTGSCALAVLARTLAPNSTKVVVLSDSAKIASAATSEVPQLQRLLDHQSNPNNTPLPPGDQASFSETSRRDLFRCCLRENHPAEEVHDSWPRSTQDHLLPYLTSRTGKGSLDTTGSSSGSGINVDLTVDNVYFESIPSEYIDVFIGENGELSREDIMQTSLQRREVEDRIFKDLYP